MKMLRISAEVLAVLAAARTEGNSLTLEGQLDRKLYAETNKVLATVGGKWNRAAQAHVFEEDAGALVEQLLVTGHYSRIRQDLGQFDSPAPLAREVVATAGIRPGMRVLEPSAGIGRLASAAEAAGATVMCVEIDPKRVSRLKEAGFASVIEADFLSLDGFGPFDAIVMNPPFAGQADIDHVRHALRFLHPGGRLVAVMSAALMFRTNRKTEEFRELGRERRGTIKPLPPKSFVSEGTEVSSVLVTIEGEG